jgi:hypothetical protein
MMRVPERYRLPIALLVSAALVVLVLAIVTFASSPPASSPTPAIQSPSAPIATHPLGDPESAVRAFFTAFAEARKIDDPTLVLPFVTSDQADAYLSVSGFLGGQREAGKASVLTVQELNNPNVQIADSTATVTFDYVEGGYDIDLETRQPLESPEVLPPYHVTVELNRVDSRWLVDSYTSRSSQ